MEVRLVSGGLGGVVETIAEEMEPAAGERLEMRPLSHDTPCLLKMW